MNAQTPSIPENALANADVLRWLADNGAPESVSALARTLGRDTENFRKTVGRIEAEGVVVRTPQLALTDFGRQTLAAIDVVQGRGPAVPAGFQVLTWDQLERDPQQPRQTFDEAQLQELEDGIVQVGRIMQNLGARPPAEPGGKFRIKHGERRWRAVGRAIEKGRLPADFPLPVEVRDATDRETLVEAVAENDQRASLNAIERAKAYERLATEDPPLSNAEIGKLFGGKTPEHVQQHRRLLRLDEEVQGMVAARKLAIAEALKLVPTGKKAAAEARGFQPKPAHVLVLVEVRHKIERRPHHTYDNSTQAGRSAQADKAFNELVREGFAGWAGDPSGTRVWLTDQAHDWLEANQLDPTTHPDALFLARQRAGLPMIAIKDLEDAERYAEDWLNVADRAPESEASKARVAEREAANPLAVHAMALGRPAEEVQAAAATTRPGLTGDDFSRQLRAALASDDPDHPGKYRGVEPVTAEDPEPADQPLFEGEPPAAADQAETHRQALVKAATPSPEVVLQRFFVATGYVDQITEPLERLRTEDDFAWQDAECPELAAHLVQAVQDGDVYGVAGLAAALARRGGDIFSQRALLKAWDEASVAYAAPLDPTAEAQP